MKAESTIPAIVRTELADTIEEVGSALGLLREAITDLNAGNTTGGIACAEDALGILAGLETAFSQQAARLATWITEATEGQEEF